MPGGINRPVPLHIGRGFHANHIVFKKYIGYDMHKLGQVLSDVYHVPQWYVDKLDRVQRGYLCEIKADIAHKERYMYRHEWRTAEILSEVALHLDFRKKETKEMMIVALFHDIGKTVIPHEIFDKRFEGKKTENAEFMDTFGLHSIHGERMFKLYPILNKRKYRNVERHHHEWWNGAGDGYPDHLKGEKIPYYARVLSIIDAYEAMISSRPYDEQRTKADALSRIRANAGTQFDPVLAPKIADILEGLLFY